MNKTPRVNKSAEEWQYLLDLEYLPVDPLLEWLNEESTAEEYGPQARREDELLACVGRAFRFIRMAQGHTTRSAAEAWQLSPGRVSQIERPGANLELSTIGELARRMGYRARVVFDPIPGGAFENGPVVSGMVAVKG